MINEHPPQRRSVLEVGLALAPLLIQLTGGTAAAGTVAPAAVQRPALSREALTYSVPA
ncbi:hypothetical protein [Streptomyces sp. NPDC092370]|uniref:hypothetical protein n=1 Tax=Streptomyces sp. NPDC092370 TaxID=3366016 RepID=UPI003824EEEC